jgi:hypothetical protein
MALTPRDADNAERILKTTSARSKAHAVGIALSLTRYVIERLLSGAELAIRNRDGKFERVVMPELEHLQRKEPAKTAGYSAA